MKSVEMPRGLYICRKGEEKNLKCFSEENLNQIFDVVECPRREE